MENMSYELAYSAALLPCSQAIKSRFLFGHIACDWRQLWGWIFFYLKVETQGSYMIPSYWNLNIWKYSIYSLENPVPFSPPKSRIFAIIFFLAKKKVSNWDRDLGFPPLDVKIYHLSDVFFSRLPPPPTFLKNPKNPQKIPFSPPLLYKTFILLMIKLKIDMRFRIS